MRFLSSYVMVVRSFLLTLRDRYREFDARRTAMPLTLLIGQVARVRSGTDYLVLTPAVAGHDWLGVNRATHALFSGCVVDIAHGGGMPAYGDGDLHRLCSHIADQGFSQVLLSGFPLWFETVARQLHQQGVRVGVLFHGTVSECGRSQTGADAFGTILRLRRERVVGKLACNKSGLPETIKRLTGLSVHRFILPCRVDNETPGRGNSTEGIQIGILGGAHDPFGKNIHNQIAAALLVEGATVHVSGDPDVGYWRCDHRLVRHPFPMRHDDFCRLLALMDVNLNLSFSESWGQVTVESLAAGVPCLTAHRSGIFDYDGLLRERLVSDHFDDPFALSGDIKRVLAQRDELSGRCLAYVRVLNAKAEELLQAFLDAPGDADAG